MTPRRRAAALVRALRDGAAPDAVLDDWPRDPGDRALRAVGTMLEGFGPGASSPAQRALLDRCAAFLESDRPYEWPLDDFQVPIGAGPRWLPVVLVALAAAAAAFGTVAGLTGGAALLIAALSWPMLDRRLRARWAADERAMDAAGEREAWPFLRRADVPSSHG